MGREYCIDEYQYISKISASLLYTFLRVYTSYESIQVRTRASNIKILASYPNSMVT